MTYSSFVREESYDYIDGSSIHVVEEDIVTAISCMQAVKYDVLLTIYGWTEHDSSFVTRLVQRMRTLPIQHQVPFMVTTRGEGQQEKINECLRLGAFNVCFSFDSIIETITKLLQK